MTKITITYSIFFVASLKVYVTGYKSWECEYKI